MSAARKLPTKRRLKTPRKRKENVSANPAAAASTGMCDCAWNRKSAAKDLNSSMRFVAEPFRKNLFLRLKRASERRWKKVLWRAFRWLTREERSTMDRSPKWTLRKRHLRLR